MADGRESHISFTTRRKCAGPSAYVLIGDLAYSLIVLFTPVAKDNCPGFVDVVHVMFVHKDSRQTMDKRSRFAERAIHFDPAGSVDIERSVLTVRDR